MQAYRLRHRIAIQEKVEAQDPTTGAISHTWQNVALDSDTELSSVPAEVLTGPGREFAGGDTKQAEDSARINLRWFEGLDSNMRIVWDGKTFDITSIETDITARREYRLRVQAGVNNGG